MEENEPLYRAFVEQLHGLEKFRAAYASATAAPYLRYDDPDIKRLLEAMAYFTARTQQTSLHHLNRLRLRLFRQFVPHLLSPLPAMGMLQALPNGQFTDALELPKGSEFGLSTEGGETAVFKTQRALKLLPFSAPEIKGYRTPQGAFRLLVSYRLPYPRNDRLEALSLYVNHLNDFYASLLLFETLQKNLQKTWVIYDGDLEAIAREETRLDGFEAQTVLGPPANITDEELGHPLLKERLYFHLPQSELFLNVQLPAPPRNWRRLTLCFDLGPDWPSELRVPANAFQLFVTPIINLQRSMARPVIYDGTQEGFFLDHPQMGEGFELHSLCGIYQVQNNTLQPLKAGILEGNASCYELETLLQPTTGKTRPWLSLNLPEAFIEPRTITTDALWHQPWFSTKITQKIEVKPYRKHFLGMNWKLRGHLVPQRTPSILQSSDDFLYLFVLQNKAILNLQDVQLLLQILDGVWNGLFAPVKDLLIDVVVKEVPTQMQKDGHHRRLIFYLVFKPHDAGLRAVVKAFVRHLKEVLSAWVADATIELHERVKDGEQRLS
jgi:type VI secretion system protein ImpG